MWLHLTAKNTAALFALFAFSSLTFTAPIDPELRAVEDDLLRTIDDTDLKITYSVPIDEALAPTLQDSASPKRKGKFSDGIADGKLVKWIEGTPMVGYVSAATFATRGDRDRCFRATARCTAATCSITMDVSLASALTFAEAATYGLATPFILPVKMIANGARDAARIFIESKIADRIERLAVREQCARADTRTLLVTSIKGALLGVIPFSSFGGFTNRIANDVASRVADEILRHFSGDHAAPPVSTNVSSLESPVGSGDDNAKAVGELYASTSSVKPISAGTLKNRIASKSQALAYRVASSIFIGSAIEKAGNAIAPRVVEEHHVESPELAPAA